MANPYYPPKSLRGSPGYQNPLSIPFPQDHPYLGSFSSSTDAGLPAPHYSQSNRSPNRPHPADQYQSNPYYDPYANTSNAQLGPQSFQTSRDNLVGDASKRSSAKQACAIETRPYSLDEERGQQLPLPSQPFARGYNRSMQADRGSGQMQVIQRPDSPFDGVYKDRPPVWEKLNPEQREILKQFPPDLDDENGGKSGFQAVVGLLKNWRNAFKLKYLHWWIIALISGAVVALVTIYHDQIVDWLTPISKKANSVPWGWTIPVAILFVISFPPLFGHEIVLVLVGIVYGLWIGFGIASLGTLLGEIGNFYAFKYCLQGTAAKYERKNIYYACMAEMVREGGFWVMFLARLSAVPGHFTTAVFATVGMNIWIFTLAAILALPKQLIIVYLGVAIEQAGNGGESTASKIIKYVVLAITVVITIWTAHWLYQRMEKVRPNVQRKLRQRRYDLLTDARASDYRFGRGGQPANAVRPTEVHVEGCPSSKEAYELQSRQAAYDQYVQQPQSHVVDGGDSYDRYYGADAAYIASQGQVQSQQAPSRPHQDHAAAPAAAHPIQYHRPMRQQTYSDATTTPPMVQGSNPEESDLSQVRTDLMQSPASPNRSTAGGHARPNIRVDTSLGANYQWRSDLGSVYLMRSEPSTAAPSTGGFQPGQVVSPSSASPNHGLAAPVPALQTAYPAAQIDQISEKQPLRGDQGHLSPVSPDLGDQPAASSSRLHNHHPASVYPGYHPSAAGQGVDRDAPPAYASTPYLVQPSVPSHQRVSSDVVRYQLTDG
ncbi:hypothetical protein ACQY0O_000311 [Thecaphora frezii]